MAKKKKKTTIRISTGMRRVRRGVDLGPTKVTVRTSKREAHALETLASVQRGVITEKPPLPSLDPMEQAREAARLAQEGNLKLCRAVEVLREAMELAIMAEVDNTTGQMVTPKQLREILVTGLDEYSRLTHQSWRRNKIVHTRAGDRDLSPESFS